MLELRNITKIYRSKAGLEVKALDSVSVSFPETGMVFVLGKSGSGKSTLLNVIGGLDGCDAGEFVIKGKSSRDFVGSDFDAYRNTFIGFIFQEYNILDDFSVGANIALALELQGKKATNEEISSILAEVDLLNFARRKPNELSGGQKQRVAIARALVKDPEIIMADEPTGALDSNTGKQIFDTLKELSKRKLVIVVSHDRDFAERYADRIIEMKDGKIESDVTKHAEEASVLSGGVHKMNDGILKIKAGYELTQEDLLRINEYLRAQEGDVYVSGDRRVNDTVRTAAGISNDGKTSSFADTTKGDVPLKKYGKEDSRFIRSSLPMKNAVKMGANSLGHKKFRLVLTIFLSLIAFALFGFADTMGSYNKFVAATDSIIDSNIKNASLTLGVQRKWVYGGKEESVSYWAQNFTEDDLALLEQKTGLKFLPVYNGASDGWGGNISFESVMASLSGIDSSSAYTGGLSGVASPSADDLLALGFTIHGEMPKEDDEIAVSKLVYEQLNYTGFKNDEFGESVAAGELTVQNNQNGILGKHLMLRIQSWNGVTVKSFKITAVIDTHFDYERYAAFIPSDEQNGQEEMDILDMILAEEMKNAITYGFHGIGYMSEDGIRALSENSGFQKHMSFGLGTNGYDLVFKPNRVSDGKPGFSFGGSFEGFVPQEERYNFYRLSGSDVLSSSVIQADFLDGRTTGVLGENEYLLPLDIKNNLLRVDGVDLSAKILSAMEKALGTSVSVEESKYNSTVKGILDYYAVEKYVTENFDALKTEYEEMNGGTSVLPGDGVAGSVIGGGFVGEYMPPTAPKTDEELREAFINDISGAGGVYHGVLRDAGAHREAATASVYRTFFEELAGKELSSSYTHAFFENTLSECLYIHLGEEKEGARFYTHQVVFLLARFEAAKAIFDGGLDYTSDTFMDNVYVFNRGDGVTDEEKESWKANATKEDAISRYAQYMSSSRSDEYGNEINENVMGGKTYGELTREAEVLLREASGVTVEDILSRATLSRFTWENGEDVEKVLSSYRLAGFYSPKDSGVYIESMLVSDGLYNDFLRFAEENEYGYEVVAPHTPGMYAFAIAPMPTDRAQIETLVNLSYDTESPLIFKMQNPVMDTLENFNDFIEMGAKIFMWVGVGFAVFSALMLMNFISISISYKKREIGILRAVGAKSSDVYKIFFSESAIIALINYVLSLATTIAATAIFNSLVRKEGINVTLLNFGVRQVVLMLLISLAVAAIASFLPVHKIARKKPVDAIKDK